MQRTTTILAILAIVRSLAAQPGQLSIPRVDLMPNLPVPYDLRNWKTAATDYDAFVFNNQLTGTYLPLVGFAPAGVNYPANESFRLHTYVGTNSPLGNEAINVLPALVGATLVGIDKSDQYGKNWLLMAQDFYNKANGENLYLNNPGASSGQDWWYDMMPNVFFYQLYDLHSDLGGEADAQFTAIADLFAQAVRAMGGHDAPWQPAYMNYRAWKFKTMEPNPNGVPEPEAAGAFAWVLYNAWKKTGQDEYRKAAEWSLEFLDNWPSNPSYELMLPYGTLTAARMNAELGTDYQLDKFLNWSFEKGPLRNWGTIVGTWGGMDVSGLVGEANDAGNDYAFQMNGMQQAAALVPLVRYDKRYARAIGKWMLNLANASRLFFPQFLPDQLQDSETWSSAYDPDGSIGYEALRQTYQGYAPFATGDAINGGWAATNLALYGTASIGYLGALVEKTGIDKILKINVLATDFFNSGAYPTFLFYNAHPAPKTIQFDAGNAPADLYDAISESFLLQDVSGLVYLTIPADQAILVTVCPAGGTISYDRNRMLVNDIPVDFRQSQQAFDLPPRFKAFAAAEDTLEIGTATSLFATVAASDPTLLSYQWTSTAGLIEGNGSQVEFTAPLSPGPVQVRCIATDPAGPADTATLTLTVLLEINEAPQISALQVSAPYTGPNGTVQLTCLATDPDLDPLTFSWSASGGSLDGIGPTVQWTAPASEGNFQLSVSVTDAAGWSDQAGTTFLVKSFSPTPGDLVADYPFDGDADDISGNLLHGSANGAVLTNDRLGIPQQAYYFNGGSQHVAVANNPLLNFQDGISVSCWFRAATLPDKETFLLSHGSWQNRWKISITPDKKLRWTVNTLSAIGDLDAPVPIVPDSFYHLTATYSDGFMALYLNGELASHRPLSGLLRTTSAPFLMGQMLPGETAYNFKGTLDAVKLFDHALIPTEVTTNYQQDLTGLREPRPIATGILTLCPNPARTWVRVVSPVPLDFIRVYDPAGRMVLEQAGSPVLDIGTWPPGMYVVVGHNGGRIYTQKLLR